MTQGSLTQAEVAFIEAITEMGETCWAASEKSGFHDKGRVGVLELCMLVVTELAELAEWERHGGVAMSEHIPGFTGAEEEWADVLIRVFDHSKHMGIEPVRLGEAFVAKLRFNATRGYRHGNRKV